MSSGDPSTRQRILSATRHLLEESPGGTISMAQVAAAAEVSRQALYLHFADRTALLVEVSREVDAAVRTPSDQRRVDEAPTARDALRAAVALQARIKPKLRGVATALDVLRRSDPAADAAWTEREHARLQRCERLATRLHAEDVLAAGWTVTTAATCIWAVTSQRVWDDLVIDQKWSTDRYRRHITTLLETALCPLAP